MAEYVFRWEAEPLPHPIPRTSWKLVLRKGSLEGQGEAAPLETIAPPGLEGRFSERDLEHALETWPAPFAFALESALLEIRARENGTTLGELLPADRKVATHAHVTVPARAISGIPVWTEGLEARLWTRGYRVIKAKARTLEDVEHFLRHPPRRLRLRLDANRAFQREDLNELFSLLSRLPLDFVEEPFPPSFGAGMEKLSRKGIRVAVDESLLDARKDVDLWIRRSWVRVAVIKPGLLGTRARLQQTLRWLEELGPLPVVFTHLLEGRVGRRHALFRALEANLPGVHGLDMGMGSPLGPSHL